MDFTTELIGQDEAPEFRSTAGDSAAIDLMWSRDGAQAPGPGAGGIVLPVRDDELARHYLARMGDGRTLIVEIQRDVIDAGGLPAVWGELGNRQLTEIWRNRTVAMAAGDAGPEGPYTPVGLGHDVFPPVMACKERGVVFHTPWPAAAASSPGEVCREESVLLRAGLPRWDGSLRRFLWSPAEARTTALPRLYVHDGQAPPGSALGARVGGIADYVRDLEALVQAGAPAAGFPCATCEIRSKCYPLAGMPGRPFLAAQRLEPLAFYPFSAVAHPVDQLSYAEHLDLLGGASWLAFRRRHAPDWRLPGMITLRNRLEHTVFADRSAPSPLAALREKLALFESVVREVRDAHRRFGQPHLGLSGAAVVSYSSEPDAEGLYPVGVLGWLRTRMLSDEREPPPGAPFWLPPPGVVAPYAADDLAVIARSRADSAQAEQGSAFGTPLPVRLTAGRVWEDTARRTASFEITASGQQLPSFEDMDAQDLVRIVVRGTGWYEVVLWARLDVERPSLTNRLALRVERADLDTGQMTDLRASEHGTALFGEATVYRTFGAFYDVHALGVLLLQALLDNETQSVADALNGPVGALKALATRSRAGPDDDAFESLVDAVSHAMAVPPLDGLLADTNACFSPDRATGQRVPARLWAELLAIGVACLTRSPKVSLCSRTRLSRDADTFCAPVERLAELIGSVRSRLPDDEVPIETLDPVLDEPGELDDTERTQLVGDLEAEHAELQELDPNAGAALATWRSLVDELAGTDSHGLERAPPDDPSYELVRAVAVEGLETVSALLTAVAELGGQEFANRQQNLRRLVRRALAQGPSQDHVSRAEVHEAIEALRDARKTVGGVVANLVEAHGRSTRSGSRKLITTLEVGIRREMGLSKRDEKKLAALMERMKENLGDLVARLYDPDFTQIVRKHVRDQGR